MIEPVVKSGPGKVKMDKRHSLHVDGMWPDTSQSRTKEEHRKYLEECTHLLTEKFLSFYPNQSIEPILKAIEFADRHHLGQLRQSGAPYIFHPLQVSYECAKAGLDRNCVLAALLHDTIEDTDATQQTITDLFGGYLAKTVHSLTKIRKISNSDYHRQESLLKTYERILSYSSKDIRPLIIKIFDRLCNMREMAHMSSSHQERKSMETLDIYSPISRRLGMRRVSEEITNLCCRYLFPGEFKQIEATIAERKRFLGSKVETTIQFILDHLEQVIEQPTVEIVWPTVQNYYHNGRLSSVIDPLPSLTILIENVIDLYTALGMLHNVYMPVPGSLVDHVSNPMANGYRALETQIVLEGEIYEVSLMTPEMWDVNELGIVHNWKHNQNRLSRFYTRYMKELEDLTREGHLRMDEIVSHCKEDEIAVFSPQKDPYLLPTGSTILDFAYHVHSRIGDHAVGGMIGGVRYPIDHEIKRGDVIQVITDSNSQPKSLWLDIVQSPKATRLIRASLTRMRKHRAKELGRKMFSSEIAKFGLDPQVITNSQAFRDMLEREQLNEEELFGRIGFREIGLHQLIEDYHLAPKEKLTRQRLIDMQSIREKIYSNLKSSPREDFRIEDPEDIFITYATCCNPIPGDAVVGVIRPDKGVILHRSNCRNLNGVPNQEKLNVSWDINQRIRGAHLNIHVTNTKGILAQILAIVGEAGMNISKLNANAEQNAGFLSFVVDVAFLSKLLRIVNKIRKLDGVVSVTATPQ